MTTESEAKGKWCPFVRVASGANGGAVNSNATPMNLGSLNCAGSECMAWRWDSPDAFERLTTHASWPREMPEEQRTRETVTPPPGEGWTLNDPFDLVTYATTNGRAIRWQRPWGDRRQGFCGLAGTPRDTEPEF